MKGLNYVIKVDNNKWQFNKNEIARWKTRKSVTYSNNSIRARFDSITHRCYNYKWLEIKRTIDRFHRPATHANSQKLHKISWLNITQPISRRWRKFEELPPLNINHTLPPPTPSRHPSIFVFYARIFQFLPRICAVPNELYLLEASLHTIYISAYIHS